MSAAPSQDGNKIDVDQIYAQTVASIRAGATVHGKALSSVACLKHVPNLRGKVIIVTGGANGIGKGFALRAAHQGAILAILDFNLAAAQETAREITRFGGQAIALKVDVTDFKSQREAFTVVEQRFGAIDIVVPGAGITERLKPHGFEDDVLDADGQLAPPVTATLDTNLLGAVYTTKLALYHLRKRPDRPGRAIVFIGSMASWHPIPKGPMYSAAKHGILGLARSTYFTCQAHGMCPNGADLPLVHCASGAVENLLIVQDTAIIEPLTRVALIGLPFCEITDVVNAVLCAASSPDQAGTSLIIDPKGVLQIPLDGRTIGENSIYTQFGARAEGTIKVAAVISDTIKVIKLGLRGKKRYVVPLVAFLVLSMLRRILKSLSS